MEISRWTALTATALVLLAGCGQGAEPQLVEEQVATTTASELALDCSQTPTVTVRAAGGEVFTEQEEVSVSAGQGLRLVFDTDMDSKVVLSGSRTTEFQATAGVSALCTTYQSAGRYAVEIGDVVALFVDVDADAGSGANQTGTVFDGEVPPAEVSGAEGMTNK
jgi:hypothetical protein